MVNLNPTDEFCLKGCPVAHVPNFPLIQMHAYQSIPLPVEVRPSIPKYPSACSLGVYGLKRTRKSRSLRPGVYIPLQAEPNNSSIATPWASHSRSKCFCFQPPRYTRVTLPLGACFVVLVNLSTQSVCLRRRLGKISATAIAAASQDKSERGMLVLSTSLNTGEETVLVMSETSQI